MTDRFTLSQTTGAKLESAVLRNGLTEIAGAMCEWMATGENLKQVAELMLTRCSHEEYWRVHAHGEKIKGVLSVHDLDNSTDEIQFVGYRNLKEKMDGWEIAEKLWGFDPNWRKTDFSRRAVTMNQIRAIHRQQSSPNGQLLVSSPKERVWNVFPVVAGHPYAVFIQYGAGGETTIKAGNWTDMNWDIGTRIFSTNQFRGSFG